MLLAFGQGVGVGPLKGIALGQVETGAWRVVAAARAAAMD